MNASNGFKMSSLDPWKIPSRWSGAGVVPIGTPVLHRPTSPVERIDAEIKKLARHMLAVMQERNGIGLAANQAGAPLRMFVHALANAAPTVIINPVVIASQGSWRYHEGCLSVKIPDVASEVVRPKMITIGGTLLDGRPIEIAADELLSRVFQHEIDHLDGIEYVQRLEGDDRDRVYALMEADGVDISWVPPRPYSSPLGIAGRGDALSK